MPSKIRITNTSLVLLTGNCNKNEWPSGVDADEEYLELAGIIAELTGSVMAVVYQIPNCPIVFPSDPSATPRQEDAQIAWCVSGSSGVPNSRDARTRTQPESAGQPVVIDADELQPVVVTQNVDGLSQYHAMSAPSSNNPHHAGRGRSTRRLWAGRTPTPRAGCPAYPWPRLPFRACAPSRNTRNRSEYTIEEWFCCSHHGHAAVLFGPTNTRCLQFA